MALNTGNLKGFKSPLPVKGTYLLECTSGKDAEGTKEDDNGEKSKGFRFTWKVIGPEYAQLDDGNSAIGFSFDESVWMPRESLEKKSPQVAARMKKAIIMRLEAAFGNEIADETSGKDFEGRVVTAQLKSKYDDYAAEDIAEVVKMSAAE